MGQRVVQKYGGASVGTVDHIMGVARRIAARRAEGDQVVVVVSAMAGETDRLIGLANQITSQPDKREMDILLASGEQVAIALISIALRALGHEAKAFLGGAAGIVTDPAHMKARIVNIDPSAVLRELKAGVIPVVAGFQGVTGDGDITTLGRGGSDLTAVALAYAIQADVCEFCKEVDGVFTTDPKRVADARLIDRISFEEMLELSGSGAKVLQTRSVEFAMKYGIPMHVRSSLTDKPGTWVVKEEKQMEGILVSGLSHNEKETKVALRDVPDKPGVAASVFVPLADNSINVDMIIQNTSANGYTDLTFTVLDADAEEAVSILKSQQKRIGFDRMEVDKNVAKISIVGVGMRAHAGVAAKMFSALADNGINIQMISTSEIKISCVIGRKEMDKALGVLHKTFGLEKSRTETTRARSATRGASKKPKR